MTQITDDHLEWAVVGRLRRMLEEPPPMEFNVTQTYALFTTILCWVLQRIRIPPHVINSRDDQNAHGLLKKLSAAKIADDPWQVGSTQRIKSIGSHTIVVPAPANFETHTVDRFLINLRDATAHGDARNVLPFNAERLLAGFSFTCAEKRDGRKIWEGKVTLLEEDMRRIGGQLGRIYCDALRRSEPHRRDSHFGSDAASIRETAA